MVFKCIYSKKLCFYFDDYFFYRGRLAGGTARLMGILRGDNDEISFFQQYFAEEIGIVIEDNIIRIFPFGFLKTVPLAYSEHFISRYHVLDVEVLVVRLKPSFRPG